jgi:hypothetical protein
MVTLGRNAPCPCGSGKKYKRCCGQGQRPLPAPQAVAAAYIDRGIEKVVFITKDMLVNQLKRDSNRIATSFDTLADAEIGEISEVFAQAYGILAPRIIGRDLGDESLGPTCARLINTAMTTFIASVELARRGYRRQYMSLIRSIVETIATVLHLMTDSSALGAFHDGKLRSTKSVTEAKKILPGFGSHYGMLSERFVHIGIGHSALEPLVEYRAGEAPLEVILNNMRLTVWLLFVTTELACIDTVPEPRYWEIIGQKVDVNAVRFKPSNREREWAFKFLRTHIAE